MGFLNIRQRAWSFDWILALGMIVLVAIGLMAIYSVDLSRGSNLNYFFTQSIAIIIGALFFFIASFMHISFFRQGSKLFYFCALLLLLGVLFFGETVRGTRGWFHFFGLSFKTAEFAKLGMILMLAWWLERFGRRFEKWQFVLSSGFIAFFLVILILLQPDLGSAIVLCVAWFGMLCLSVTKKRYLFILLALAVFLMSMGWFFFMADYQKERVLTFVEPARDPLGSGYNVAQSVIAIGAGKFFGRGLGFGSQSQLHFLPEAQTDFIFSVIAEELGFVGALSVLLIYLLIFWRLLSLIKRANSDFSTYFVTGVLLLLLVQITINLGAVMGFLPAVGVTLPFLSYGGSSLIINMLLLGIVESIAHSGSNPRQHLYEI